ncbi:hypothetical protein [Marinicella sp. W31]|uniref:hypothetical protein n=1 Tax=Marinicella sp. W31 TaxID=3023713 RepID=UPI0037569EEA
MTKKAYQLLTCIAVTILLASCGGSSDSGGTTPGGAPNNNLVITITTQAASVPTNLNGFPIRTDSPFLTQVNVNVAFTNGTPLPDGTNIQLRTSNVQRGPISTLDDPTTTNVNEFTTLFGSIGTAAAGGLGTFFIHGGDQSGQITLTASAVNPDNGRTSSSSVPFTIVDGPEPFDRLSVELVRNSLPVNSQNIGPEDAIDTLLQTEANIVFRDPLGNLFGPGDGDPPSVGVTISPVLTASFSTLDNGETDDVNEIFVLLGQGPVNMTGGRGKVFIWSGTQAGTATLGVNAFDPFTGDTISVEVPIEVVSSNNGLPDSVIFSAIQPLYVVGSGGRAATTAQINVFDSDLPVPNPNGFNNTLVEISVDGQPSGEQISGVNINGQNVSGSNIAVATTDGFTSIEIRSGTVQNTVRITATADRADNNVDNGLQDPVTTTRSVAIGDGVLHALDITGPDIGAIFDNRVNNNVDEDGNPLFPRDGTYSLVVSAIGTDKAGNPALPQEVQFGLIDSPLVGFPQDGPGTFAISSNDGDPQEGGTLFTDADGQFVTEANGVQPSDTLMVFGEEINGNEDLESANRVQNVNSETSLNTLERFNRNNGTGTIINDGPIFPYIIGRAVDGNIFPSATLDQNGVATTLLNYPVSKLGKLAAISVKGQGIPDNGDFRSVVDVELLLYPGLQQVGDLVAQLIASPILIGANQETVIVVCAFDALGSPLQGLPINWTYSGEGVGTIDEQSGSGTFNNATGADGCSVGQVRTAGLVGGDSQAQTDNGFNFTSGILSCTPPANQDVCVAVAAAGASVLTATPSAFIGDGTKVVLLTLTDGGGNPIPGVALQAQCTATNGVLSVSQGPGITNDDGTAQVFVQASVDGIGQSGSGECTFSAPGGDPSTTVQFVGRDICQFAVSPNIPAGCP